MGYNIFIQKIINFLLPIHFYPDSRYCSSLQKSLEKSFISTHLRAAQIYLVLSVSFWRRAEILENVC